MVGYDLIFGGIIFIPMGVLMVRYASEIQVAINRIEFLRGWNVNPGGDSNPEITRITWVFSGWLCIAAGTCALLWFIPINLHIVHWPKY